MVEFQGLPVERIMLPRSRYGTLIDHCLRKLEQRYLEDETGERKAYGLVGGRLSNGDITVGRVVPLKKNARTVEPYKRHMDELLGRFAIPSETPLDKRAWVADPVEARAILMDFARNGLELVGTYHMHRVGWESDPLRDTPTVLDTALAEDSEVFLFVVSTVNPDKPIVRAFFEGVPDKEVAITSE